MKKPENKQKPAEQAQPELKETDEKQELVDQLQRLQAEFENYRKRVDFEIMQAKDRGEEAVIKELFPVIDSFELAIKHHSECEDELLKGVELIYSQLLSQLERLGVHRIPAEGIVDPRLHEVYIAEQSEQPEHTIIEVLQQGYTRNGTVLRTAKVRAARKA